ncbi:hypothetical protein QR680_019169 [Steinernema hermaphroditum]|uniref:Pre-mRNA-splicing factor SLU7 n=1 Tax=Steinernema hermaphroditum TaxID=289476 RepID=A0AA39HL64_9BILA|nr:hypothetical protein QR680_019169 [Steinernema hermaphroditum]
MATFNQQTAVSEMIRSGGCPDELDEKRKSKAEYQKQRDLEEQRKAGTAPAMVDVDTGRDINPHIPQFISQNPWYVPSSGPTLKHQRPHPERQTDIAEVDQWYARGVTGKRATKWRKGACENCGAMGHKERDCFERPRKKKARFTNRDIAGDDIQAPELSLGFDAKRDRWNGYDPKAHEDTIEQYKQTEELRRLHREQQIKDGELEPPEENEDEDKYADDADMAGVSVDMDSRTRITVRNLRIREDTAKYLYNLDPNGPHYDPKSRSMRENPFAGVPGKEKEAAKFSGENFVRYTGEVVDANEAQVFAWNARCQGVDVHALAEPTKLEQYKRDFEQQKEKSKKEHMEKLLETYGGREHLEAPSKELLMAQTENYVEYSRTGSVIKGQEKSSVKSRFDEDVYPGNHSSVWGSYWEDGKWGYRCCRATLKNAYCTQSGMRDGPIEMVSRLDVEWSAKLVLSSDSHQSNIFSIRFFFLLLEWAVHGVPWIIGTVWAACRSFHFNYPAHEQRRACILVFGIFLDLLITGILKLSFRRPRPPYNKGNDQIFDAPVADKFSFPSGHSSRSAMLAVLGFALIQPQDLLLKAALFAYPVVLGR